MKRLLTFGLLALATAAVAYYFQSSRLTINGQVASNGIIERNGVAYVPLKDLATALKMTLTKNGTGYVLADAGGAGQINGLNGKVGDMLWNGAARFQVVKVIRGKTYTNQFSGDHQVITPYPEGNDLVIVVCRIKNGTTKTVTCALPGGNDVGLTDTDEHSFGPRTGLSIDCPSRGQSLLPGAAVDFALTFDVPAEAKLKDLVYQVAFYEDQAAAAKRFRVSLEGN